MTDDTFETPVAESPLAQLERTLIDEFMRAQGHDPRKLADLPALERDSLLTAASFFASSRLAEIESRSHFLNEIHDGSANRGSPGAVMDR